MTSGNPMMKASSCRLVAALVLVLCVPTMAAAKWTRLKTENFLFVGDAPERQIREIAQRLEQFREVMSRILPSAAVATAVPTIVFVFQTDRSMTPYKPRFEGRPVDVAGYFLGRPGGSYVTMNGESQQDALLIIYHEYAHFITRNLAGNLPLWANEGLAGVYETFETGNGGRSATIGIPHDRHLGLLKDVTLMPLRELLAVDRDSPVYNEGSRRGVFYAESWALMHYLMFGNQARTRQLGTYLAQVKNGLTPEQAFTVAFGGDTDALERELREYIRRYTFPGLRVNFDQKVTGAGAGRGDAIDDLDANAYLGELLSVLGRVDDARRQLQTLVAANPQSARAVGYLGLLEFNADKLTEALPLLERAAVLDPTDGAVQRALGGALYARSLDQASDDAAAAATLVGARSALRRAIDLRPGDTDAVIALGRLESSTNDHAGATTLFERAVAMAPAEERYRLMLADSLVHQEDYARATTYLGPLLAASTEPSIKDAARGLLTFVAERRAAAAAAAAADGGARRSAAASPARRTAPAGGRFIPELRAVGAGERRVLGMFTSVECGRGAIALVIEADGETLRLATADLAKVAFITYRPAPPGGVTCGPVSPAPRVFATFIPDGTTSPDGTTIPDGTTATASNVTGRAVAIELLPDDFTP
jgi:tetratricopeptide (TPR) repeat protein